MSDREAFIQAVIADPSDDTPRLVMADWLDDRGEAEYAELIRVQCELAKLPAGHPVIRPLSSSQLRRVGHGNFVLASDDDVTMLDDQSEWSHMVIGETNLSILPGETIDIYHHSAGESHWFMENRLVKSDSATALDDGRVQHYIVTIFGGQPDTYRQKRTELQARESQLLHVQCHLAAHRYLPSMQWKSEPYLWRRGFIEQVTCTEQQWLRIGRDLMRQQPVTRVLLSDKEPHITTCRESGKFVWCWWKAANDRHSLSKPLWHIIMPPEARRTVEWEQIDVKDFDSKQAAIDALSEACLTYGRQSPMIYVTCDYCREQTDIFEMQSIVTIKDQVMSLCRECRTQANRPDSGFGPFMVKEHAAG